MALALIGDGAACAGSDAWQNANEGSGGEEEKRSGKASSPSTYTYVPTYIQSYFLIT